MTATVGAAPSGDILLGRRDDPAGGVDSGTVRGVDRSGGVGCSSFEIRSDGGIDQPSSGLLFVLHRLVHDFLVESHEVRD
jgi:hypothetical protein